MVGWKTAPQLTRSKSLEPANVTFYGKREFTYRIKRRILRWMILYYVIESKCKYTCPYKREAERFDTENGNLTTEARCYTAGCDDEGRGQSKKCKECGSQAEKVQEIDFPLQPPEGAWPCGQLVFSPATLFGLLTSRAVRDEICILLSHQLCSNSLATIGIWYRIWY